MENSEINGAQDTCKLSMFTRSGRKRGWKKTLPEIVYRQRVSGGLPETHPPYRDQG